MRTLCFFGTYDPDTARVQRLKAGWEAQGGRVIEVNEPVWPPSGARAVMAGRGEFPVARLLFAQQALWRRRAEVESADAVLVPYPGHFDMWLARRVAAGKPLAFDPFVSLYETAVVDRALFSAESGRGRLTRAVDRRALQAADVVLADTGPHAAHFAELGAVSRDRLRVVPLGADERVFRPAALPAHAGCEVLFYGTMIPLHGVDVILKAARLLEDTPEIRFHLVGSGQVPVDVAGLPNVRWTPWLPYAELPRAIAQADVCLGLFGSSEKAARVVPHKVYEAAAVGRPIITADTPAVREAFPDNALLLIPPHDPQALATALRDLAVAPVRRSQLAEAARAQFQAAYETKAIGAALVRALSL